MANSNYNKGVSDWNPMPPDKDITEKLMSPNAVEKPDSVSGSNPLEQFTGKSTSAKSYGTLGRRGKQF